MPPTTYAEKTTSDAGLRQARLNRGLVLALAVAAATAISSIYYCQPLLASIAHTMHMSVRQASYMPMLAEIGYALGLACFVPLGDMMERRRLITSLLCGCAVMLAAIAIAPNAPILYICSLLVGMSASVVQVVVPLSAALAAPGERGEVVGFVNCGMLLGILLARTIAGLFGGAFGWRAMYAMAAALTAAVTLALSRLLPQSRPEQKLAYGELIRSLKDVIRDLPDLREAALLGALGFGALEALWSILVFFIGHTPYHYGARAAGLLALGSIPGALIVPMVGRTADRRGPLLTTGMALTTGLFAYLILALGGHHLLGLIAGIVVLDIGVHSNHVSNQARIYALTPSARNRINTVYMVAYFFGGAFGTMIGANAWSLFGWPGIWGAGMLLFIAALSVFARGRWIGARAGTAKAAAVE